jgi:alginate O-acetyltransferase complex protein AlgI
MAIGLGKIFGFRFLENFNYPFISRSISEFWRRWHISLGSWFRDYVYIPLGGNRVNRGRMLLNIFVVWFLTGFWHGAEWNFIIWGLYFGVMLTLEKFFFKKFLREHKIFGHIYTLFFVTVSFMIFAGGNLSQALGFVGGLFGFGKMPLISTEAIYYFKSYGVVLVIAAIGATPLPKKALEYARQKTNGSKWLDAAEIVALLLLVIIATSYLVDGSFNPFLYFRF